MVSGPITSWQTLEKDKVEAVIDFPFLGSKITADHACSHEIKRCLLLGRSATTYLDSILKKQRHHFTDKGLYSQSYGFSSSHIWMWELEHKEGWVLKNWCFWIVVLEKHLECPLQRDQITSILKEINPEYSLEVLLLKLKLHYFGHMMQRVDSLEKTLRLGKTEGKRRRGWQRMRWLHSITNSMDMNIGKLWEIVKHREAWHATFHAVTKSRT